MPLERYEEYLLYTVGITVKMTNLLSVISVNVQLEPFTVNAIKKSKWSFRP